MRILWVKTGPLLPLDTGGKRRTHAMLTEISRAHEVTYLALLPAGTALHPGENADPYAVHKLWVPTAIVAKNTLAFWLDLTRSTLFSSKPYALEKYDVPDLREKLRELSHSGGFDLVICDFLAPALNFVGLDTAVPCLLFQHNIESQIWQRLAASQFNPLKRWYFRLQYRRMLQWEARLSALFAGVITVSPEDTALARSIYDLGNILGHVPTGVDVTTFQPASLPAQGRPFTIGFLGSMDWMPNIDATLYFVHDILPTVRAFLPDCRFKIIGRNPPAQISDLALNTDGIEVTGTVVDVQPHVHECDAIVVPLKAGGGTRIKIYEAMAMGVPVVSTTIGAEGLDVNHGTDILLADDAKTFAQALVELAQSPELRQKISSTGRQLVAGRYSWLAAANSFMQLCSSRTSQSLN
jgi:glycosyltransferase involved in cell wall biosynthesis